MTFWEKFTESLRSPAAPPPSPSTVYGPSGSSVRSASGTYVARRDGESDNDDSHYSASLANSYSRSRGIGDVYSRGGGDPEKDRNELFSGYNPAGSGSRHFFDGPNTGRDPTAGGENEEDIEGIKQQTRFVKQESVTSTRNALRLAREAEETARSTLTRLDEQSEKLSNIDHHLDVAKGHSQRAEDKTDELRQLNRTIFRPVVHLNKDDKRTAQSAEVQRRYVERREERKRAIRENHDRLGGGELYGGGDNDEELKGHGTSRLRMGERKRYQIENTASDDELEDQLDENIDEIDAVTRRLNLLSKAMAKELDDQCNWIGHIDHKTSKLDDRILNNTENLKRIK